MDLDKNLEVT